MAFVVDCKIDHVSFLVITIPFVFNAFWKIFARGWYLLMPSQFDRSTCLAALILSYEFDNLSILLEILYVLLLK